MLEGDVLLSQLSAESFTNIKWSLPLRCLLPSHGPVSFTLKKKLPPQNLIHTPSPSTFELSLFPCCCLLFHSFSLAAHWKREARQQPGGWVGAPASNWPAEERRRRSRAKSERAARRNRYFSQPTTLHSSRLMMLISSVMTSKVTTTMMKTSKKCEDDEEEEMMKRRREK